VRDARDPGRAAGEQRDDGEGRHDVRHAAAVGVDAEQRLRALDCDPAVAALDAATHSLEQPQELRVALG